MKKSPTSKKPKDTAIVLVVEKEPSQAAPPIPDVTAEVFEPTPIVEPKAPILDPPSHPLDFTEEERAQIATHGCLLKKE